MAVNRIVPETSDQNMSVNQIGKNGKKISYTQALMRQKRLQKRMNVEDPSQVDDKIIFSGYGKKTTKSKSRLPNAQINGMM